MKRVKSVHDVAAYILERLGSMSTMKLQKLVYYSQAWHLVWDEEPLFAEPIEAWANGPVVRELYNQHRGRFKVDSWPTGDSSQLDSESRATIDVVIEGYGQLDGRQLSALTHSERPWLAARAGLEPTARSDAPIDLDVMQDFYTALDSDGTATPVEELDWSNSL